MSSWLIALAACSSTADQPDVDAPSAQPLTCDLITGPNCWTEAVASVRACAPGAGTLSPDATSCTFANGSTATFTGDVTSLDLDSNFSIDVEPCIAFSIDHGTSSVRTLRTASGEASWRIDDAVTLRCPDGSAYSIDALTADRCSGLTAALGYITQSGANGFAFTLMAKPDNVPVLDCER
jgi:hypothetical protein